MNEGRLPTEFVLLGFLSQGSMHGYELHERFESDLGKLWRLGMSRMYAVLKQLEVDGYVASGLEPQENRPARRVFSITADGCRAFEKWVREPEPKMSRVRVVFFAKLYFALAISCGVTEDLIRRQIEVCRARITDYKRAPAPQIAEPLRGPLVEFRLGQIEATVSWLERLLITSQAEHAVHDGQPTSTRL